MGHLGSQVPLRNRFPAAKAPRGLESISPSQGHGCHRAATPAGNRPNSRAGGIHGPCSRSRERDLRSNTKRIYVLTSTRNEVIRLPSRSMRGPSPETFPKVERIWRPAAAARNRGLGRSGNRPSGITTRPRGVLAIKFRRQRRSGKHAIPEAKNRQGGAPEGEGTIGSVPAAPCQRGTICASGAPPPLIGEAAKGFSRPGRPAPRERKVSCR
jgi:hypothetical protein